MKLSVDIFDKINKLLDTSLLSSEEEYLKVPETGPPGIYKTNKKYIYAPFEIVNYSLKNEELKNIVSELCNQDPDKITTIHRFRYFEGSKAVPHFDKASWTFVLIIDSNELEGGEFYLKEKYIDDFKEKGDYVMYNGGTDKHEVKEIKKGYRDVLVVWWNYDKNTKNLI